MGGTGQPIANISNITRTFTLRFALLLTVSTAVCGNTAPVADTAPSASAGYDDKECVESNATGQVTFVSSGCENLEAATLSKGAIPNHQFVLDFESGANQDDNALGIWGQMSASGFPAVDRQQARPWRCMMVSLLGMQLSMQCPEIWTTNVSILDTMTITTVTSIIVGAKPVDAFDEAEALHYRSCDG